MRGRAALAALVLTVAATLIALVAFSAHTGYVHINPEYWPAFAYAVTSTFTTALLRTWRAR
jgi:hypothetical protein